MFEIAKTIPDLKVEKWKHIWRIYTHPVVGVNTVRTKRGVRAQLDAGTGEVLAVESYSRDSSEEPAPGSNRTARAALRQPVRVTENRSGFLGVPAGASGLGAAVAYRGDLFPEDNIRQKETRPPRMPSRASANTDAEMEPVEQPIGGY